MNPFVAMLLVAGTLATILLLLRHSQQRQWLAPELLRKSVHLVMGLVAASFPWLFDQRWPVVVLAIVSGAALLALRRGALRQDALGQVLHSVDRQSWGELYFPIAIALLFAITLGQPLLYSVPILILTLADATAALIGVRYGQKRYSTLEGHKSLEGSVAFFLVTFLCVHIAVLLFTPVGRLESLLIATMLGLLVMMFEAVAWRGLDNLFIPLAAYMLLKVYLPMDSELLAVRLAVLVTTIAFFRWWRKRSTLDDSALIGAMLVAYGSWAIGGLSWLLPALTTFVATMLFARRAGQQVQGSHSVHAVLSITAPGLFWLLLAATLANSASLQPYLFAYSAQMGMIAVARRHYLKQQVRYLPFTLIATAQGWLLIMVPSLLVDGASSADFSYGLIGLVTTLGAVLAFLFTQPGLDDCPTAPARWWRQGVIAGAASLFGAIPLLVMHLLEIGR